MQADACRFAHPQPPVPQGVPQDLLLILGTIAGVGVPGQRQQVSHSVIPRLEVCSPPLLMWEIATRRGAGDGLVETGWLERFVPALC